ncbi:MAG: hypothetical protein FJ224_01570 [Lentisphaerae bacterium]|nr:hypothetical protein [Lentisphaerota bacterium]
MPKTYCIRVFGKSGCEKCTVLQQRLDKLLAQEEWKEFDKEYCPVDTEDGLASFAEAECVNPNRIPAFVVMRLNAKSGEYEPIPARRDPAAGEGNAARLTAWIGLQTDYGEAGRGVLPPRLIEAALREALNG